VRTAKGLATPRREVDSLVPTRPYGRGGVYRQRMIDRLFGSMLSARLAEIAQKPDAPFIGAGTGRGTILGRTKDNTSLSATVKDGGAEKALETLVAEVERVGRFRLPSTELD